MDTSHPSTTNEILVVGGYGEVGTRLAQELAKSYPESVVVGGRNPERARAVRSRRIDLDAPRSIDDALNGVATVVACVRQRDMNLMRAAVRRGIAYTSIAPPTVDWQALEPLHAEAQRTGARIIHGTGLEPGIASMLVRSAADRIGQVDAVETALLLSLGDSYGADAMGFIFDEIAGTYAVAVGGQRQPAQAFDHAKVIDFPSPVGRRRAYRMPFTDQRFYPQTLGAKTAVARIALDPPWLADVVAGLTRVGLRALVKRRKGDGMLHEVIAMLRRRYAGHDLFSLLAEVRGAEAVVRASLTGHGQARATALGAWATAEALHRHEVSRPGVWFAEQVLAPDRFLERLASRDLIPVFEHRQPKPERARRTSADVSIAPSPQA